MGVVVYAGNRQPEGEVDARQYEKRREAAPSHVPQLVAVRQKEGGERAQQAEYRAARAHADGVLGAAQIQRVTERARAKPGQQIYRRESDVSVNLLRLRSQDEQPRAVQPKMPHAGVQEHRRQQPPVIAGGDSARLQRPERYQRSGVAGSAPQLHRSPNEKDRRQKPPSDKRLPARPRNREASVVGIFVRIWLEHAGSAVCFLKIGLEGLAGIARIDEEGGKRSFVLPAHPSSETRLVLWATRHMAAASSRGDESLPM